MDTSDNEKHKRLEHRDLFFYRHVFSSQVLRLLVQIYQRLPSPDFLSICQCLMFLDESEAVANILVKLLKSSNKVRVIFCPWFLQKDLESAFINGKFLQDYALLAFQIAFDLVENEHQAFLLNVRNYLPDPETRSPNQVTPEQPPYSDQNGPGGIGSQNRDASGAVIVANTGEDAQMADGSHVSNGDVHEMDPNEVVYAERLAKIKGILSGETSIQLTLQFLYSHNR